MNRHLKIIIYSFLITILSCKKENDAPLCSIISPENGAIFLQSETINVTIKATDVDNNKIDVFLYLDEDQKGVLTNPPFMFVCNTDDSKIGEHNLRATVSDGKTTTNSKNIHIKLVASKFSVTTYEVNVFGLKKAILSGYIANEGGLELTEKGFCWSFQPYPTINNNKISCGMGLGSFYTELNGLGIDTTYYIKAYASNGIEISYGNLISFKTPEALKVLTFDVSEITSNSAKLEGYVENESTMEIMGKGFCWSTKSNPTINDNKIICGADTGNFHTSIIDLVSNITYYLKSFAITEFEIAYGNEISFTTNDYPVGTVIDIEGNVYKTIKFNNQNWMAENLRTTQNNNGVPITELTENNDWTKNPFSAYCWYNNDSISNSSIYGALYTTAYDGLCPSGWHIPSNDEWQSLFDYFRKSVPHSSFKEVRGGYRSGYTGAFMDLGQTSNWWSSSQSDMGILFYYVILNKDSPSFVFSVSDSPNNGKSVRCIENSK